MLTIQSISQDASLDTAIEKLSFNLESRNIASCGDIANSFHHQYEIHSQHWQYEWAVDSQLESVHPDETRGWGSID
jgi:hypothetical protein